MQRPKQDENSPPQSDGAQMLGRGFMAMMDKTQQWRKSAAASARSAAEKIASLRDKLPSFAEISSLVQKTFPSHITVRIQHLSDPHSPEHQPQTQGCNKPPSAPAPQPRPRPQPQPEPESTEEPMTEEPEEPSPEPRPEPEEESQEESGPEKESEQEPEPETKPPPTPPPKPQHRKMSKAC